jgi:hypothetical protein
MKKVTRQLPTFLALTGAVMGFSGCSGGLNVNRVAPATTALTGTISFPDGTTQTPTKIGAINVVVPALQVAGGAVSGTIKTSTLGDFNVTGTVDGRGKVTAEGARGPLKVKLVGQLTRAADGSSKITGTVAFAGGSLGSTAQVADIVLTSPAPHSGGGAFDGTFRGGGSTLGFSLDIEINGTTATSNYIFEDDSTTIPGSGTLSSTGPDSARVRTSGTLPGGNGGTLRTGCGVGTFTFDGNVATTGTFRELTGGYTVIFSNNPPGPDPCDAQSGLVTFTPD